MIKQFRENSHRTIEDIKRQQYKHRNDIVQPRIAGEVNPEYVKVQGAKALNVSKHDVERMAKIDGRLAKRLNEKRTQQNGRF
jgi:hypothetical protein